MSDQKKNDGGPAFPTMGKVGDPGMSLRQWYAGEAIALFSLDRDELALYMSGKNPPNHKAVAEFCFALADAMIEVGNR